LYFKKEEAVGEVEEEVEHSTIPRYFVDFGMAEVEVEEVEEVVMRLDYSVRVKKVMEEVEGEVVVAVAVEVAIN
jgi:hypothetical protein